MNYSVLFVITLVWSCAHSSCVTPLNQRSNCVPLNECPSLFNAFKQKPLPNSIVTFLRESQCGFEGYTPTVCCGPLPQETNPTPASTARPVVHTTISGKLDPVNSEDSVLTPRNECGIDTNGDRIYGGQITELDEFPWMALLGYKPERSNALTYQCGGVLVNHRYVLSAAHCVIGEIETAVGKLKTVRLGEYDLQNDVDCFKSDCAEPVQEIAVQSAYPHPGFSDKNQNRKDDISLLRLAQRVRYSFYVKPICLASNDLRVDVGSNMFVAGWGKTLSGTSSQIKLKLKLPIFSKIDCAIKYKRLGATLTDNQVCAGGVFSEDACRGDSGGPLMRNVAGTWEAIGVVSFGYGCGRDGWPGVYTSVPSYRSWIEDTMRNSNV